MKIFAVLFLSFILFPYQVYAQSANSTSFDLGGGVIVQSNIREGKDPIISLVPIINFRYKYERLILDLPTMIAFQIYEQEPVIFSTVLSWRRGDIYCAERNSSLLTGVSLKIFFLNFAYLKDISNNSNGSIFNVIIEGRPFPGTSKLSLMPSLGLEFQDQRYVDYYYGVKSEEASTDRQEYKSNSAINYFASINSMIPISNNLDLSIGFGVIKYGKGISDSPSVRKDIGYNLIIGVVYKTSLFSP